MRNLTFNDGIVTRYNGVVIIHDTPNYNDVKLRIIDLLNSTLINKGLKMGHDTKLTKTREVLSVQPLK